MENANVLPQRIVALVSSVLVALASGTPYLYGIYAPQLVEKVGLKTSDSAIISLATNLGCGLGGLPAGIVIDIKGPSFSIIFGSFCIFIGYYSLYKIYVASYSNLSAICASMVIMGFGSILCYFTTIKVSQINFPKHKGIAGSFPVSAYGLSATIFSLISTAFFGSDTSKFLRFLSICCGLIPFLSSFLVKIYLVHEEEEEVDYEARHGPLERVMSDTDPLLQRDSNQLGNSSFGSNGNDDSSLRGSFSFWGIGSRTPRNSIESDTSSIASTINTLRNQYKDIQTTSINRQPSAISLASNDKPVKKKKKHTPLETIKRLLQNGLFIKHYLLVSMTSGIGQMYIYSVGFIVAAQFSYIPQGISTRTGKSDVLLFQALQVSIISICSFSGRLSSGFISDMIYKKFHFQRLWVVCCTISILLAGQLICLYNVHNKHLVSLASACIGLSYGLIFGAYPAVIADMFGTRTFSTAWGLICTGPCFVLFVLNKYFGEIFDSNIDPNTGKCPKGNLCYDGVFKLNCYLCFISFFLCLYLLYTQRNSRSCNSNP